MYADTHIHLCPGLDDGPRDLDEALQMCQLAWNEGVRMAAVTGHQNDTWRLTPEQIISAADQLAAELSSLGCPLELSPMGEVMLSADTFDDWQQGRLLSIGNHGCYLLVEFPHNLFLDIRDLTSEMAELGVRLVLAHAERYPELLHGGTLVDGLIRRGCIIQVSSAGLADPASRQDMKALRDWARRGVIHVMCSDAHSPRRRRPAMRAAYQQLAKWTNTKVAQTICWHNGAAVLAGESLRTPVPTPPVKRWFSV